MSGLHLQSGLFRSSDFAAPLHFEEGIGVFRHLGREGVGIYIWH